MTFSEISPNFTKKTRASLWNIKICFFGKSISPAKFEGDPMCCCFFLGTRTLTLSTANHRGVSHTRGGSGWRMTKTSASQPWVTNQRQSNMYQNCDFSHQFTIHFIIKLTYEPSHEGHTLLRCLTSYVLSKESNIPKCHWMPLKFHKLH